MFERFGKPAREAVHDAQTIARELGATTIEAEHVLLAVTRTDTSAARALRDVGLDEDGLREALEAETARSLAAVGVTADAVDFGARTSRTRDSARRPARARARA